MSFYEKYAAFQAEIPNPAKEGFNPHFNSKFTELDKLLSHVKKYTIKHGLILTQNCEKDLLITKLIDPESGEGITSTTELNPDKNNLQGQGSARTYSRRYEIELVCGIFGDKDDDGNNACKPENIKQDPLSSIMAMGTRAAKANPDGWATFKIKNGVDKDELKKMSPKELRELENEIIKFLG